MAGFAETRRPGFHLRGLATLGTGRLESWDYKVSDIDLRRLACLSYTLLTFLFCLSLSQDLEQ